ncbi:MAG TPA: type I-E CRISPR-associated protein Cas5/CasD [Syntrophales bacterium]|nr:type I-E CRISPR-associated protein Cas5/CasD [Syntrophales bacterium]HOM08212.1 type I-E CRISPR-associated protein Cas5/CasD [Syntrophales bacterium]HPQ07541.1 type I-E CRISPR-associated protein Cas5/CasD [Syntrophales bacterium]
MDCLLLRFDAPLMSFGGVCVDNLNHTDLFPGRSMITGLIGNALGWDHADTDRLRDLQERLRVAARWDADPRRIIDYQTVDLGQEHLVDTGWTTRGMVEERGAGKATRETHIRYRHYLANGVLTAAVTLVGEGYPALGDILAALRHPARPLFIGRKACLPATPIFLRKVEAASLLEALRNEPLADIGPRARPPLVTARWPAEEGHGDGPHAVAGDVYDRRDWPLNMPRGLHRYFEGPLEITS